MSHRSSVSYHNLLVRIFATTFRFSKGYVLILALNYADEQIILSYQNYRVFEHKVWYSICSDGQSTPSASWTLQNIALAVTEKKRIRASIFPGDAS